MPFLICSIFFSHAYFEMLLLLLTSSLKNKSLRIENQTRIFNSYNESSCRNLTNAITGFLKAVIISSGTLSL